MFVGKRLELAADNFVGFNAIACLLDRFRVDKDSSFFNLLFDKHPTFGKLFREKDVQALGNDICCKGEGFFHRG